MLTARRDMFRQRHAFDGMVPGRDPYVFASEYAVLQDGGWGNLQARPICMQCPLLSDGSQKNKCLSE